MNEVAKNQTGGLPANILDMAAALAQSAGQAGSSGAGELYLKMTKFGEWVFGAENTEMEEGQQLAINPQGFQHGWVAWGSKARGNDGTHMGEVMVPATTPLPLEGDLPEVNGDWSKAIAVQMKCLKGEDKGLQLIWKANSLGARKAYASILQAVIERITAGNGQCVPIVELGNDQYTHNTYGVIKTPEVTIVGWMGMDGEQAEEPVAAIEDATPSEEPAPEEKPARRRRRKAS